MGLTSPLIDGRSKYLTGRIVENIVKNCPTILSDESFAREFLNAADDQMINGVILQIGSFWSPKPNLIFNIPWNQDLALLAIGKSAFFYEHLPKELKQDNEDLAFATMFSSKLATNNVKENDLKSIVKQVRSSCSGVFSNATAIKKLLSSDNEKMVMTVLAGFCDKFIWDQELVDMALPRFPAVYSFLPACFRNDDIDAQHVISLLVHPDEATKVKDVISKFPSFFADAAALKEVFLWAGRFVTIEIVASMSPRLPWNRDLNRLAARRCHDGEYHGGKYANMADVEIERIYRGKRGCKHHLPLGMLLSYVFVDRLSMWPDFLNHCGCALRQDDSLLLTVLNFLKPMLRQSQLSKKLCDWLQGLVDPIMWNFQNQCSFQALLKCITVAGRDGQEPLDLFPRDVETSKALKRMIAEFLVGSPKKAAEMKQDALKVVYCLLTLPSEFLYEMSEPVHVFKYKAPFRPEDTFYCEWCCDALAKMDEKYNGNHNNRKSTSNLDEEDDEDGSDEDEDGSDEDYEDGSDEDEDGIDEDEDGIDEDEEEGSDDDNED